ncbi:MAG: hypothetical protein AAF270_04160 [Pseudomonadota bacterium]
MTSDNRINRRMVEENNLVDRYLLGQMDESEAMAFEDFYAGSPETLEELETSALLIDGMNNANRKPMGSVTSIGQLKASAPAPTAAARRWFGSPAYGVAASFVAALALLVAGSNYVALQDARSVASSNIINIPVVTLSPTRGGESGVEVFAGDAPQVVLALDLGLSAAASYSAALQTIDGDHIWRSEGLEPDELQSLTMSIARESLPAGSYRIVVRSEDARNDTLNFPFDIAR